LNKEAVKKIPQSFMSEVKLLLPDDRLSDDLNEVLDELARQTFYAISEICDELTKP
jgi:hypothetical protein